MNNSRPFSLPRTAVGLGLGALIMFAPLIPGATSLARADGNQCDRACQEERARQSVDNKIDKPAKNAAKAFKKGRGK